MKTNRMVQGAMIAAIFGVLSVLNTYTGSFFDSFIGYFMVAPVAWYGYRYSLKDSLLLTFVSLVVIIFTGLPYFIIIAATSCLSGVVIGECLKKKAKRSVMMLGVFIVTFISNILITQVLAGVLGVNLNADMKEMYGYLLKFMPSIKSGMPLSSFLSLMPLLILFLSVLEGYVELLMTQALLKRFKITFPENFHISTFKIEQPYGYILAGMFFGSFILTNFAHVDSLILRYMYLIAMIGFMIDGMAVAAIFLISKGKGRLSGLVILMMFIPLLNTVLVILGILDIFGDLRDKILYNKNNL